MNYCAKSLIEQFKPHILLSYGFSDQFIFVFKKTSTFCDLNLSDILSVIVSNFTSNYVFNWSKFFDCKLQYAPAFKANYLLFPVEFYLIQYILAKHHECYISNLNATLYSALIGQYKGYKLTKNGNYELESNQLESKLDDQKQFKIYTNESALNLIKNQINSISKINEYLFHEYDLNYNNELEIFRKGTFFHFDEQDQLIKSYNMKLNEQFLSSILINQNKSKSNQLNETVNCELEI